MVSKGDIWLINLNPIKKKNEIGKIRPAVVFQTDELNKSGYPTTIVFPLSTSLVDDAQPIRFRVTKREKLEKDSDLILTQIRAIDNSRFIKKLGSLTSDELKRVKELFDEITF
jgi:mRNA interferase MazF